MRLASLLLVVIIVMVVGCAWVRPAIDPAPWDAYGDRGPLRVRGAPPASAGRVAFAPLARDQRLAAVLRRAGEPDTVEVLGSRFAPKRIVLRWERRGAVRRVVVDSTRDDFVVETTPPARAARVAARRGGVARAAPAPERAPVAGARPTVAQTLECPIDPARADCRALCTPDAAHEWCARP